MSEQQNIPDEKSLSISERVQRYLDERQADREFKDYGERVAGSRKEMAAFKKVSGEMFNTSDLAKMEASDSRIADEMIKKDKVLIKFDPEAERANGVSSAAAYCKVQLRRAFAPQPFENSETARKLYVGYATVFNKLFSEAKTLNDIEEIIDLWNNQETRRAYLFAAFVSENWDAIIDEFKFKQHLYKEISRRIALAHDEFSELMSLYQNNTTPEQQAKLDEVEAKIEALKAERTATAQTEPEGFGDFINITGNYSLFSHSSMVYAVGKRFYKLLGWRLTNEAKKYEPVSSEKALNELENALRFDKEQLERYQKHHQYLTQAKTMSAIHDYFYKGLPDDNGTYDSPIRYSWKGLELKTKYIGFVEAKKESTKEWIVKNTIREIEGKIKYFENSIASIEERYRPKDEDWSWAAKDDKSTKGKKKAEMVINKIPPLPYIKRTGGIAVLPDMVSEANIVKIFGFKSVQLGNYVKDDEAREHIRHFLAALTDLCEVLNMDVKFLNEKGGLSMAFGARGKGGKASAHYEPAYRIINLTKMRGGGAVAHEYLHYIDNMLPYFFGRGVQKVSGKLFASNIDAHWSGRTATIENDIVWQAINDIFAYIENATIPDTLIPILEAEGIEVRSDKTALYEFQATDDSYTLLWIKDKDITERHTIDSYWNYIQSYYGLQTYSRITAKWRRAIGQIVKTFGYESYKFPFRINSSEFYGNSVGMKSPYWAEPWELMARSFECYVVDKMAEKNMFNNYLVYGYYHNSPVYPQGFERKILFHLYDRLFAAIKAQLEVPDFVPWTDQRVDEYIALDADVTDSDDDGLTEEVEEGVILDSETGETIAKVGEQEDEQNDDIEKKLELAHSSMKGLLAILNIYGDQ